MFFYFSFFLGGENLILSIALESDFVWRQAGLTGFGDLSSICQTEWLAEAAEAAGRIFCEIDRDWQRKTRCATSISGALCPGGSRTCGQSFFAIYLLVLEGLS